MTVVMIEHDMGVVMDISHRVMVLDFGAQDRRGEPAAVLADPHVKRAYLGEEDDALVDPDELPHHAGRCGRMDYVARVGLRQYLPEAAAASTPANIPTRSRSARRISASGASSPGATIRRGCRRLRAGLAELGLGRGDVVALIGDNRPIGSQARSPPMRSAP